LILVAVILRRWQAPRAYALMLWCHPWFLARPAPATSTQFAFFAVLTAVLADRGDVSGTISRPACRSGSRS
jgi:hypothetical protein